jgi:putative aldouronate transport system substrate-binding protein
MGRSASAVLNLNTANSLYISVNVNHPEWKVRVYDGMNGKGISMKPYIQNGMGISANSRNPERAMMFMDLVRNDQQYADLVTYGLEGIHYELTEEGKVRPLARSIDYPIDDNCNWGWRNEALMREIEGGIPNYDTIRSAWEEAALIIPYKAFPLTTAASRMK